MAQKSKKVTARRSSVNRKPVRRASKTSKRRLLLPHSHTFKLVHRRHTSYPLAFLMLMIAGVLLFNWTSAVSGLDYQVNAKVPAEPLTEPATILTPVEGTVFKEVPIEVNGQCPINSYVKLTRNGYFSGVALCESDGTFHIQTDLFEGANELQAQDYNITDDPGPVSTAVKVYYRPPAQPKPSTTPAGSSSGGTKTTPLILGSEFIFKGYQIGQTINWSFTLSGGAKPYAVHIDWGDGLSDTITRTEAGEFGVSHVYNDNTSPKSSYTIKVQASDAAGAKGFLQLVTVINVHPEAATAAGTSTTGLSSPLKNFLKVVWPTYGLCLLILGSFWLGERREFELLHPGRYIPRPRRHA
jgi:hypothetical protein